MSPRFHRYCVVTLINDTIAYVDVLAAARINAICIANITWGKDSHVKDPYISAEYWVQGPEWRIRERHVRHIDVGRVN